MWIRTRSRDRARACALGVALATCVVAGAPTVARADAPAEGDAADRRRELFKSGMDDYANGRYHEAIAKWEAIYREIEPRQGYRLAFNLARAYDKVDDPTRAAEHYETYVAEVKRRRDEEIVMDPAVERQADDATARLEELKRTHGRIAVGPGQRVVRIDNGEPRVAGAKGFVAYVAAGKHVVRFDPDTADERSIEIDAADGALVTVETPAIAPPPAPAPPPIRWETHTERPFSPTVLWIAGGVTVASLVLPAVLYANALSTKDDFDQQNRADVPASEKDQRRNDYYNARSNAYVSFVLPAALGVGTAALATWFFLRTTEARRPVRPAASVGPSGGTVGLDGAF